MWSVPPRSQCLLLDPSPTARQSWWSYSCQLHTELQMRQTYLNQFVILSQLLQATFQQNWISKRWCWDTESLFLTFYWVFQQNTSGRMSPPQSRRKSLQGQLPIEKSKINHIWEVKDKSHLNEVKRARRDESKRKIVWEQKSTLISISEYIFRRSCITQSRYSSPVPRITCSPDSSTWTHKETSTDFT